MRALLVLAAAAVLAVAAFPERGEASCASVLSWRGHTYAGFGAAAPAGAALAGKATRPGCDDTGGDFVLDPEPGVKVAVRRVRGVDPLIAITDGHGAFVNPSTFVNLPSHPLHERLGSDRSTTTAGTACRIVGRAIVSAAGLMVERGKAASSITVAADTAVTLRRRGTGYVAHGTRIVVTGRCTGHGVVAATRIARAPSPSPT